MNVLDLGIYMSDDCTFNYNISSLSKKCANLWWILRTFYIRDCITVLTLFKSIVLSRLDYGPQLWSPFLIKNITQLEKIQQSFTKHITGMNDMPYHERLKSLGLYSLQRRRERYCIIYIWKIIEGLSYNSFRWRSIRLLNSLPIYVQFPRVQFLDLRLNLIYS